MYRIALLQMTSGIVPEDNAQTIVGTKRGASTTNTITVHIHVDTLLIKIEVGIVVFLVHHI